MTDWNIEGGDDMTNELEYDVFLPVMVKMTESGVMLGLEINFEDMPWPRVETVFHNGAWIQGWSIEDRAVRQFGPWLKLINSWLAKTCNKATE